MLFRLFASLSLLCLAIISSCSPGASGVTARDESHAANATWGWLQSTYGFVETPELSSFLEQLLGRLRAGTELAQIDPSGEFTRYPWQLYVLNTSDTNAFSLGSGVIVVTKGLLLTLRSEAELASVVSHEMAHTLLGHTRIALADSMRSAAQRSTSASAPTVAFSLANEIEADTLGLRILDLARYDTREALYALSLSYRPADRPVSPDDSRWREDRAANLAKQIELLGRSQFATRNSREFVKLQRAL